MSNVKSEKEIRFTVSEAASFLGVSPKTLRRWDEAGILVPTRDPRSNYRYYEKAQLENYATKRAQKSFSQSKENARSSIMGVTERDLKGFLDDKVNLEKEKLAEYRAQVENLISNLKQQLRDDEQFGLREMKHFGSCAKKTAISTVSDLDVAVYLTPERKEESVSDILSYVKELLIQAMTRYGMSPNQFSLGKHCVRVIYKGSKVEVDVVPIIPIKEKEGNGWGLLADRDTGNWLETSVPLHLEFIKRRRDVFEKYAEFVRLTKWWKEQHKVPLKSFAIELIWAYLIDNEDIPSTFCGGLPYFFRYTIKTKLQERISFTDYYPASEIPQDDRSLVKVYDPVCSKNNVTKNMTSDDYSKVLSSSQEAMNVLMMATCAPSKNKAIELWQRILGNSFNPYQ